MAGEGPTVLGSHVSARTLDAPAHPSAVFAGPGVFCPARPLGLRDESAASIRRPLSPAGRYGVVSLPAADSEITLDFGPRALQPILSVHTLRVLRTILRNANVSHAHLLSTSRMPADDARVAFNYFQRQDFAGPKRQEALKDPLAAAYVKARDDNKPPAAIVKDLENKIAELGPTYVGKFRWADTLLDVVNIAADSIRSRQAFVKAVTEDSRVENFLCPPMSPHYHLEFPQPRAAGSGKDGAGAAPPPPPPPRKEKTKTWIEFQFVDDATNRPIPNVQFIGAGPDGIENYYTTNSTGKVRINDINAGKWDLHCNLKNARFADTLDFVAVQGPPSTEEPLRFGTNPLTVAHVEPYKVTDKDSIASLAQKINLPWQALAKFNWDTDVPTEINKKLRTVVGCTRKTKDGKNYMFSSHDEPGIVYLPRPWKHTGLSTSDTHVIRLQKCLPGGSPFLFSF